MVDSAQDRLVEYGIGKYICRGAKPLQERDRYIRMIFQSVCVIVYVVALVGVALKGLESQYI